MFSFRDALNSPRGIIVAAVILLGSLLWLVLGHHRGGNEGYDNTAPVTFMDEQTHEVIIKTGESVPPLIGKSGQPTVVMVIYYTCDRCSNKKVRYLLKYSDDAKAMLEKVMHDTGGRPTGQQFSQAWEHALVRKDDPASPWTPVLTEAGQQIMTAHCPDGHDENIRPCGPLLPD